MVYIAEKLRKLGDIFTLPEQPTTELAKLSEVAWDIREMLLEKLQSPQAKFVDPREGGKKISCKFYGILYKKPATFLAETPPKMQFGPIITRASDTQPISLEIFGEEIDGEIFFSPIRGYPPYCQEVIDGRTEYIPLTENQLSFLQKLERAIQA